MALNERNLNSDDVCAPSAAPPPHGDTELLAGAEPLPCGRPLGRAWEQARAPFGTSDAHTVQCPYCREAVEGLTALDRATHALRIAGYPDGHSLASRVINAVRAEVRLGALLLLNDPSHDLRIAESAAAKVLRRAADTVPGTRAASCRLSPSKGGHVAHIVAITVAAKLDRPLREQAEAIRQAVLHAAEHVLGLAVTAVDVDVNAVLEPSPVPGAEGSHGSVR
ncbi:Asp23/Gls24 family envelope stress response protein [Streptomyces erythrochromogenes]|uniref:hypothetical protein n=1 Tax=Streptomyces erythrochromogenes TaxID=285574 RepID=UPI00368AC006